MRFSATCRLPAGWAEKSISGPKGCEHEESKLCTTVSGLEGCRQIKHKQAKLCMMASSLVQQQDLYTKSITAHLWKEQAVQAENTAGCLMRKQQLAGSQLDGNP